MAAPWRSGKSASVLPAFLYAEEKDLKLTHYLYMPFRNNDKRHHLAVKFSPQAPWWAELVALPGPLEELAKDSLEAIGAQYMLACFQEQAFNNWYIRNWSAPATLMDVAQTEALFKEAVGRVMQGWPQGTLLIHVDEHKDISSNRFVRRGALKLLSSLGNCVKVICTYTVPPPVGGPGTEVCRVPVEKPMIDIGELMRRRHEFSMSRPPLSVTCAAPVTFNVTSNRRACRLWTAFLGTSRRPQSWQLHIWP